METAFIHRRTPQLDPEPAEHLANERTLVGHGKDEIAGVGAHRLAQLGLLVVAEELGQLSFELGVSYAEPRQALGAELLRHVRKGVEAVAADVTLALDQDPLDARGLERFCLCAREHGSELDQLHPEAHVWL